LTARSLWFDEAFSWRLIQFPLAEMISRAATDVHPPLYYLLLKSWSVVFATSLLSLRVFSVILAGLTIWLVYLFTSYAVNSRPAGLLAAFLLATSGWQIQFAWEARMYTLATALVLLSSWLLLRAIRTYRLSNWLLYALVAAALLYTHYYAVFSLSAHLVYVIGYLIIMTRGRIGEMLQSPMFWSALAAFSLVLVLFLPWLPTFIAQNAQVQDSYWIPPIGGWSIPDTFYRMFIPTATIPLHAGIWWIMLAALPMTLTVLGLLLLVSAPLSFPHKNYRDAAWLVFLLALIPFVCSIALSFIGQSLYQDRFFVLAHIFILISLAVLLDRLPFPRLKIALVILTVTGLSFSFISYLRELDITDHPGSRAAMAVVARDFQPADKIVAGSPFIYFAALHYAKEDYDLPDPKLFTETGQLAHFAGGPILRDDDVVGPTIFDQAQTMWVIDTTGFGSSPLILPAAWQRISTQAFSEVFSHQGEVIVSKYQNSL
jgi:uncharacterized membrane protein